MIGLRDITGQHFGRLTVLGRAGKSKDGKIKWRCRCQCGNERDVTGCNLATGHTRSCGCMSIDTSTARLTSHGMTGSPEHKSWTGMRERCTNPRNHAFQRYAGRGITVCERWLEFDNFFADMGPKPSPKHSIDRIDNDKGYEPGNCRWATPAQQNRNRRNTVMIELDGERLPLGEACERAGVPYDRIHRLRSLKSIIEVLRAKVAA